MCIYNIWVRKQSINRYIYECHRYLLYLIYIHIEFIIDILIQYNFINTDNGKTIKNYKTTSLIHVVIILCVG